MYEELYMIKRASDATTMESKPVSSGSTVPNWSQSLLKNWNRASGWASKNPGIFGAGLLGLVLGGLLGRRSGPFGALLGGALGAGVGALGGQWMKDSGVFPRSPAAPVGAESAAPAALPEAIENKEPEIKA